MSENIVYYGRYSDVYRLNLSDYSVENVSDMNLYGVVIPADGVLKDWRGDTISVSEGDVIFIKDGKLVKASDIGQFFKEQYNIHHSKMLATNCEQADAPSTISSN